MIQILLTIIIVTLAVSYAVWLIVKALRGKSDPCAGCKGCALREEMRKKADCDYKRQKQQSKYQEK